MNLLLWMMVISMAAGETPYTTICQKEKPKGTLPSICLKYCQIAEQGCHPGLWEWKEQNGCTEKQEAYYIELRRMTLQVCQDILENCIRENLDESEKDNNELSSSCSAFCEAYSEGPQNQNYNYNYMNDDKYGSLLKSCKDSKEKKIYPQSPSTPIPPPSSLEETPSTTTHPEKIIPPDTIPTDFSPSPGLHPEPPLEPGVTNDQNPEKPESSSHHPLTPSDQALPLPTTPEIHLSTDKLIEYLYILKPQFPKEIPKEIPYILFFIYTIVLFILFRMVLTDRRKISSIEHQLSGLKKKK